MENLIPPLIESHLGLLFKKKTNYVGSTTLLYSIKFIEQSTRIPVLMNILQPYLENILFETTVPIILVTTQDAQLFKEEPIEFLRRSQDTSENLFSAKNSMIGLV